MAPSFSVKPLLPKLHNHIAWFFQHWTFTTPSFRKTHTKSGDIIWTGGQPPRPDPAALWLDPPSPSPSLFAVPPTEFGSGLLESPQMNMHAQNPHPLPPCLHTHTSNEPCKCLSPTVLSVRITASTVKISLEDCIKRMHKGNISSHKKSISLAYESWDLDYKSDLYHWCVWDEIFKNAKYLKLLRKVITL